mgnify:CR=1 FL=1
MQQQKSHYSAPPHEWVLQQCRLFLQIAKQYKEKYAEEEALARADVCIDRVFCQWSNKEEQHKHRRGFLQELRAFLRQHISMEEITAEEDNIDFLAQKYSAMLDYHFNSLLEIAITSVYADVGVDENVSPSLELVAKMENARQEWNKKRIDVKQAFTSAVKNRDYAKMHTCKTAQDLAEKMFSYYGHAIVRIKKDISKKESSDATVVVEETPAIENRPETIVEKTALKEGPFVTFLKSDSTLAVAAEHLANVLRQYVDPANPTLHQFAPSVEKMAFVEASSLVPQSPILSTIALLSGVNSNAGKLANEKAPLHSLIGQWTSKLKESPFLIAKGINDRRGQIIREQKVGQFNNVCRSAVDANVLRGIGRTFSSAEFHSPENVFMLFCAEPGCFHIDFYHTNADFINPKAKSGKYEFAIEVRLKKPHITLSNTVLAPGYYLLDQTIYMPGIDRGRAVAVASQLLHSAAPSSLSGKKKQHQNQLPAYMTAEYDGQQVEELVEQGRWEDAQTLLLPTKILHAGNASLFLAASTTDFETLGFIIVGNAGRCMINCVNISNPQSTCSSAYKMIDKELYTKSVFSPATDGHDSMLYVDALCGVTNTKTKTTRGIGFCLMAHALAYSARLQPSGILMRVRNGAPPLNSTIDASIAFYYYSHFGMQCVSSNVARDVGFIALAEHYKGRKTVSKRTLKEDNLYAHVRNILSALQDGSNATSAGEEQGSDEIDIDLICGKKENTLPASFIATLYKHDEKSLSNVLYRQYPHISEIYDRVVAHLCVLNGGSLPTLTTVANNNSNVNALEKKTWNFSDDHQFENGSAMHEGDASESVGASGMF